MLDVTASSLALSVDWNGVAPPEGHIARYPSEVVGTTVAFSTYACPKFGTLQLLVTTLIGENGPEDGGIPPAPRVSTTRQGVML